jgi:hypothetical protein
MSCIPSSELFALLNCLPKLLRHSDALCGARRRKKLKIAGHLCGLQYDAANARARPAIPDNKMVGMAATSELGTTAPGHRISGGKGRANAHTFT